MTVKEELKIIHWNINETKGNHIELKLETFDEVDNQSKKRFIENIDRIIYKLSCFI